MKRSNPASAQFKEGDVVYFVYLHLDEATKSEKESSKAGHFIYEIECKARPMLVRRAPRGGRGGKMWYSVLYLTTQQRKCDRTIPIGRSIDNYRESYISPEPIWYPENLVSAADGRSPKMKSLDRTVFDNIMRIVSHISQK